MNVDATPKKNWAFIFSPSVVLTIIVAIVGVYSYITATRGEDEAYLILGLLLVAPCLLVLLVLDVMLRGFLKGKENKTLYIWVIEPILMVAVFLIAHFTHIYW
ncbi:hypothetical protein L3C95_09155 [Chitinophaga filiformis]|uniref:hypothetical protein n=1 Tax=Chitinophaga filiformis TaxID=104663 RepID=UPI001F3F62A0|nr:hypothetical protein [Chitinophaga filiformis]MCF6403039.1 hypothetical protein [Chitinophaga filiformis]